MFSRRNSRTSTFILFIFIAIVVLIFLRSSSRASTPKTIQFVHTNGEIGDQLFSLFSHIGVAKTIGRIPTINTVNNSQLIEQLSKVIVVRFPSILQQFSIVIQPPNPVNGQLGSDGHTYEDPVQMFAEYATLSMMIEGNGFKSYKYFDHLRKKIRLWMLGNAENVQEAKNLLSESLRDNFKVCVHSSSETEGNSTIKATSKLLTHYLKEMERVMLVVSTTNPKFSRRIFEDPRIKKLDIEKFSLINSPPELQLTFSRIYCDVVFLTSPYSTSGWWMAYLAKNEDSHVFYFDPEVFSEHKKISPNDFFPPEWKKLTRKVI